MADWRDYLTVAANVGQFIPGPQQPFVAAGTTGLNIYQGAREKGNTEASKRKQRLLALGASYGAGQFSFTYRVYQCK